MFNAQSVFTPFTHAQQFYAAWQRALEASLDDPLGRMDAFDERCEAAAQQGCVRAHEAIDAWAALMKAHVSYCRDLGKAWRQQAVEMAKTAGKAATGA